MKRILKKAWNRFVEGFETGVFQIVTFVAGLGDETDFWSLQQYLPERWGRVFMGLAIAGILCRYFIKVGWIRPFENVEDTVLDPGTPDGSGRVPQ